MKNDLSIWRKAFLDCDVSFEGRPDGSSVVIVKAHQHEFRRVLPVDRKDADQLLRRIQLDLLLAKGESPTKDVIENIDLSRLPTYTNHQLYKTRAASLWERRRLKTESMFK